MPKHLEPNGAQTNGQPAHPALEAGDEHAGYSGVARPASFYRNEHSGFPKDARDPAETIPGMAPNFGESMLPHVMTFQGIISSISRVYRPSDEALKHSWENARYMRNDPVIRECIDQRQRSVSLLNWHLEPDDPDSEDQQDLVKKLTRIIEEIPYFTEYRRNLLHAIWYGRYGINHIWGWQRVGGAMRALPRWVPIHGDKLVFRYDDGSGEYDPNQVGIRVGAGYTAGDNVAKRWRVERINKVETTDYGLAYFLEPWEAERLLAIHKHQIEDGEYEEPVNAGRIHGVGLRSVIYWAWYQKQETLAWLMEYLERSAFGIEIWYYPSGNNKAKDEARTAAEERIGQGRNIVLVPKPLGDESMAYGVERIEPGMAGADVVHQIVNEYFGHQIKRYILGQTLTTEAHATGLGSNLATIHLDTYLQIIQADSVNLEETMTKQLVNPIKQFNFPTASHIPVKFRIDTEAADVESKLAAWEKAYQMGMKLKAQDVADLIGASVPDANDEVLQMPREQMGEGLGDNGWPRPGGAVALNQDSAQFGAQTSDEAAKVYAAIQKNQDARKLEKSLGVQESENSDRLKMGSAEQEIDTHGHDLTQTS